MNVWHKMGVFIFAARLGFKEVFAEGLILFGTFLSYSSLVVAYSNVFRGIPAEDLAANGLTISKIIWYFGITEFVLFSGASIHFKELQYDIQNDQIHLSLLRPCPVWVVRIGEWFGQALARFAVLTVPCLTLTGFFAGSMDISLVHLWGLIFSLPFASLLLICFGFMLGSSCLWLKQAEPAFWIWQKLVFLLGALLWPLALYPNVLQKLVWFTPFPSILAVPGNWALNNDAWSFFGGFASQVFWVVVCLIAVSATNRAVLRRIQNSGE